MIPGATAVPPGSTRFFDHRDPAMVSWLDSRRLD
jgi:hypothetical protein